MSATSSVPIFRNINNRISGTVGTILRSFEVRRSCKVHGFLARTYSYYKAIQIWKMQQMLTLWHAISASYVLLMCWSGDKTGHIRTIIKRNV